MKTSLYGLILTLISTVAAAQSPTSDIWTTSYGKMKWSSDARATYGGDEGRLIGVLNGNQL
jgi:hypothetical protein